MKDILYIRALIVNFVKRHENYIIFAAKFFAGLALFNFVFSLDMYYSALTPLFTAPLSLPFMVLLAVGFAFLPVTVNFILLTLVVAAQLSTSLEASTFSLMLMTCLIVFYVRLSPQRSYLILAIMAAFYFKVPYAVVIFSGLYMGVSSILPIAIGTFAYFFAPTLIQTAEYMRTEELPEILELPGRFMEAYTMMFEGLTGDYSWVIITFVFIMVILGIYAVSRLSIDFAKEISIAFGGIVMVLCFSMASLVIEGFELSILSVVIGSAVSAVLVFFARFFDGLPDYQRTENVTFEDDENYYYCKIVPKLAFPQGKQVKADTKRKPKPEEKRPPKPEERRKRPTENKPRPLPKPEPENRLRPLPGTETESKARPIPRADADAAAVRSITQSVPRRRPTS
jgi:hypothetical protein